MNPDDPKFTAYALGELQNDDDRTEVEKALTDNPELQKSLDEIRSITGLLENALKGEPAADLTDEQKEKINAQLKTHPAPSAKSKLTRLWPYMAMAACLILTVPVFLLRMQTGEDMTEIARYDSDGSELSDSKTDALERDQQPAAPIEFKSGNKKLNDIAERGAASSQELAQSRVMEYDDASRRLGDIVKNTVKRSRQYPVDEIITSEYRMEKNGRRDMPEAELPVSIAGQLTTSARGQKERVKSLAEYSVDSEVGMSNARMSQKAVIGKDEISIYPPPPPPYPIPEPPMLPIPGPLPVVVNGELNTESYDTITDNPFLSVRQNPLSTFSIDVDTASYANVRRFLNTGRLPPIDAVRIEEFINYFTYDYDSPEHKEEPFTTNIEVANAPWQPDHRLVRIGLKGYDVSWDDRPAGNLVFLLDVSGSMSPINKLPLVKQSLELLVKRLNEKDRVAIVTYAGESEVALPSTTANNRDTITHAIHGLRAGGSTHASSGIENAYEIAEKHFIEGGNNRIILCTDGDFNIGVTNRGDLVRVIEDKARSGIYLSIFGFGMGNYKDATLEELSNKGNGNYGYIDELSEARKVFVTQISGTLLTIAKDVKIQVEFNPSQVHAYRLIGYENRRLAAEDFNDDTRDAGEIGAGHTVTALYEVVPVGVDMDLPSVDPLKYQNSHGLARGHDNREWLTVKLRYKHTDEEKSRLIEVPVFDNNQKFEDSSEDYRFAAAVASFGMILRDSPYKGDSSFKRVQEIAEHAQGYNKGGYRSQFLLLVDQAEMLSSNDNRDRDSLQNEYHEEE